MTCNSPASFLAVFNMLFVGHSIFARDIPLKKIHATTSQSTIQKVTHAFREENGNRKYIHAGGYYLDQILRDTGNMGASTVLLVRGKNIGDAIKATRSVMTGGRSADVATVSDNTSETAPLWAAVYLGVSGSSPPAWLLGSVSFENNTVRVSYKKGMGKTKDRHQYWFWIPLSESKAGTYTIELVDIKSDQVVLMRRVRTKEKIKPASTLKKN